MFIVSADSSQQIISKCYVGYEVWANIFFFFFFINHVFLPKIHFYVLHIYGEADNVCVRLLMFKAVHIETEIYQILLL